MGLWLVFAGMCIVSDLHGTSEGDGLCELKFQDADDGSPRRVQPLLFPYGQVDGMRNQGFKEAGVGKVWVRWGGGELDQWP